MRFDWDLAKNQWTLEHRELDFDFASRIFDGFTIRIIDTRQDYGELRVLAFGEIDGRVYVVVFTMREPDICRICSARKANDRETKRYWKARGDE